MPLSLLLVKEGSQYEMLFHLLKQVSQQRLFVFSLSTLFSYSLSIYKAYIHFQILIELFIASSTHVEYFDWINRFPSMH